MSAEPKVCREKVWPERSDAEKLEALRQEVLHLGRRLSESEAHVRALLTHVHVGDKIATPIDNRDIGYSDPYRGWRQPMSLRERE